MIYHESKYMSLGSGDICVGSSLRGIHFQNIKPPQECGSHIYHGQGGLEFTGEIVELRLVDVSDCNEFDSKLSQVETKQTDCMEYRGWKLYFLPGSDVSVSVVRKHFERAMSWVLAACAC